MLTVSEARVTGIYQIIKKSVSISLDLEMPRHKKKDFYKTMCMIQCTPLFCEVPFSMVHTHLYFPHSASLLIPNDDWF